MWNLLVSTHPSAQYLVDSCALLKRAFRHHLGPHLLHIQHEGIQWFLDVRLLLVWNETQITDQQQQQQQQQQREATSQADSYRLPNAVARVKSCGNCAGQRGTAAGFP
jgi:hypothetical protein